MADWAAQQADDPCRHRAHLKHAAHGSVDEASFWSSFPDPCEELSYQDQVGSDGWCTELALHSLTSSLLTGSVSTGGASRADGRSTSPKGAKTSVVLCLLREEMHLGSARGGDGCIGINSLQPYMPSHARTSRGMGSTWVRKASGQAFQAWFVHADGFVWHMGLLSRPTGRDSLASAPRRLARSSSHTPCLLYTPTPSLDTDLRRLPSKRGVGSKGPKRPTRPTAGRWNRGLLSETRQPRSNGD